jgi:MerR family mercuric resistance operon transcriptional regulator
MIRSQASFSVGTIGGFAKAGGVGVETVRFYQREGLLPVPPPGGGAFRQYDSGMLRQLRFIRSAQAAGFSLAEIKDLLRLDRTQEKAQIRRLARARLTDLEQRVTALRQLIATMETLIHHCEHMPAEVPCPIVEAIAEAADVPNLPRGGSGSGGTSLRARSSNC